MTTVKPSLVAHALLVAVALLCPQLAIAHTDTGTQLVIPNAIHSYAGYIAIATFVISYIFVILEEFLHLRKSKPVVLASGVIWIVVAIFAYSRGLEHLANQAVRENILEYAELLLFLLVAMTYVNAMQERKVFDALRDWLILQQFSYKKLFWATGILAFFISPIADNLTTALIMCAVVMAVGKQQKSFVILSCINIVVAANAGGAFSPFGDITTLMVWQAEKLSFMQFFSIFIPSCISFLVPATIMSFAVPYAQPAPIKTQTKMLTGAKIIVALFLLTIVIAVICHNYLHLPPMIGMMTGLSLLKLFGYYLKITENHNADGTSRFDIIKNVERAEWDTLLFFYGIILSVGGLATLGYLGIASQALYGGWGELLSAAHQQTPANVIIGLLSAIIDNIPVMYAVLTMDPAMSQGQWLLITLTAGIGGSLLSVGSAAGVALMGQARGIYTFFAHLKWSWAILLGYIAGVSCHLWLNSHLFN